MSNIDKVSVIGIGGVGTYTACYSAFLAKNVLVYNRRRSEKDERTDGLIRDMCDGLSHLTGCNIIGTNNFEDLAGSDVVVITIGLGREFGFETRDMLFFKNASLIKTTLDNVYNVSPDSRIIIASNPVDYMGRIARISGFAEEKIFCLGGVLDTARLARFICEALYKNTGTYVNPREIEDIHVIGSHGPKMIPVFSHGKYRGKYLKDILDKETMEDITKKTRLEGATITKKKGKSGSIGPGASIARMIEKLFNGQCVLAHIYVNADDLAQLGLSVDIDNNVFLGMPFILKSEGRQIVPVVMTDEEKSELKKFVDGQKNRDHEVEMILSKTQEGLSTEEKIENFIAFMAEQGVIIKPLLGEEGGYEVYKEGEGPNSAVTINIWKYI